MKITEFIGIFYDFLYHENFKRYKGKTSMAMCSVSAVCLAAQHWVCIATKST